LELTMLAIRGAEALGAVVHDHGLVTTPQLHYMVMHANSHYLPNIIPQRGGEDGYFETICHGYVNLLQTGGVHREGERCLMVDGACGIGYPKVVEINRRLAKCKIATRFLPVNGKGSLNHRCGAEFVQKTQTRPFIYEGQDRDIGCSLDGDADRIVFFHHSNNSFRLLDGDKIAALVAIFVMDELRALQMKIDDLRVGVVQTAYANGACTNYLKDELDITVKIAKTGVKYVHHTAHEHFDVGIYFEANGHGTVLFSPKFYALLHAAEQRFRGTRNRSTIALQRLRILPSLVNQAVGDALSDLLLVDAILYIKGWNFTQWDDLYRDLPSFQCKVKVPDRSLIRTNENETQVLQPTTMQPAFDSLLQSLGGGTPCVASSVPAGRKMLSGYMLRQNPKVMRTGLVRAWQIWYRICAEI